jgi:hypothetical protein
MSDDWKERVRAAAAAAQNGHRPPLGDRPIQFSSMRSTEWCWRNRIPLRHASAVVGAGGTGKGTLLSWVIARLTKGELDGEFAGTPVHCAIVGEEDDAHEQWAPRIAAHGGDDAYLHQPDREVDVSLDREALRDYVREHDIRFMYLDAILDNLGRDTNANQQKDVRQDLRNVRVVAREEGIAITYALHPNKSGAAGLRARAGGSGQFTDVPRSALILGYHPEDEGCRVLARGKGNVGRIPPALVFRIEETLVLNQATNETVTTSWVVDMREDDGITAEDVLESIKRHREDSAEEVARLVRTLGHDGTWRRRKQALQYCLAAGVKKGTFEVRWSELVASGELEIRTDEEDRRHTWWRLPPEGDV